MTTVVWNSSPGDSTVVAEGNGDECKRRIHRCDGGIILPMLVHRDLGFGCGGKRRGLGVAGAIPGHTRAGVSLLSSHRGDHRKVDPNASVPVARAAGDEVE